MDKVVKGKLIIFTIIGIIFSIFFSNNYLLGDKIFYKDVINRFLLLIYYKKDFIVNPIVFIKDFADLLTAGIQYILLGKGIILNSLYIFIVTEMILRNLRKSSLLNQIISRFSFYFILSFKPYATAFWDHHVFFLIFAIFSNISVSNNLILRYFYYFLICIMEFLLIPFLILKKTTKGTSRPSLGIMKGLF